MQEYSPGRDLLDILISAIRRGRIDSVQEIKATYEVLNDY